MIRRLKDRKAARADEIPSEVWKYEGEEIMKWVLEFCNKVWRGKGWPREWKERILVSLLKKKKTRIGSIGNYREISIIVTLYKIRF